MMSPFKMTPITRKFVLAVLVFLWPLFFTACGPASGAEMATPTPLPTPVAVEKPTYTVQSGTVTRTVVVTGRVAPVTEQRLFFRSAGFVRDVFVSRDTIVEAGDLLAELEIDQLEDEMAQAQLALQRAETSLARAVQSNEDALAEAQIQLETARLRLQRAQSQNASAAVTSAQVAVMQAEEALAFAQEEYGKALDRPWEPEHVVEGYAHAVTQAERNLTVARARHNEAAAGQSGHHYDRQILEQDVALAEQRVAQLERGVDPLLTLDVQQATLAIERLERQVADARLTAPFAGQVISLNLRPGMYTEAFQPVMVLAEPSVLEVTVESPSDTLNELSVGMPVTVQLRNRPGAPLLAGSIRQLPLSGAAAAASQQEDRLTRIALEDETVTLEMGELATVTMILEEREDVLWLPPAAIRLFQGRSFVVVQDGDIQRRVDVRLGIQGDDRVEIMEGVASGQIAVGP
jgi:multidrug efflux pump subunit AcrA (membrane-fusion protein)